MAWVNTFDNVGNGVDLNQVDHLETQTLWSMRNGGVGVMGTNVRDTNFTSILGRNNTDGAYFDTLEDSVIYATDLSNNNSQGAEMINSNNVFIVSTEFQNNTSDGLKLTSDCDKVVVTGASFKENGGYGINVASSTNDGCILSGNVYTSNVSGEVNDSGINTRNDLTFSQPIVYEGLTLIASSDSEKSVADIPWTKQKEIELMATGTFTISFDMWTSAGAGHDLSGKIYRSGGSIGSSYLSSNAGAWNTYSQNLGGWSVGDKIQLYCTSSGEGGIFEKIRNFRIYGTTIPYSVNLS
jgi:hypothetical protein